MTKAELERMTKTELALYAQILRLQRQVRHLEYERIWDQGKRELDDIWNRPRRGGSVEAFRFSGGWKPAL